MDIGKMSCGSEGKIQVSSVSRGYRDYLVQSTPRDVTHDFAVRSLQTY